MSDQVRQFTVAPDDDGIRLDRWFKRHLPQIGFATVNRWARTGQIRVDGGRAKPDDRLAAGQKLRVPPGGDAPKQLRPRPELSDEQLAYAEAMLIERSDAAFVLNKPPGLATQGGTGTTVHVDGLLDAYANEDEPRPRLVHRLDKDTSGVLLVARSPGSAAYFSKHFSGRSAKKIYWALVVGVPDIAEGTIDAPLAKQPGSGGEKMHVDEENGQPSKTRYRVIDRAGNRAAWVELQPLTGRTHQLRVHLAAIGHPIVGDGKYGGQAAFLTGSISRKMHLHARRLVIGAPKGKTIDVTAELPEHFAASMEQLGFDPTNSRADPAPERMPETREQKKQAARQHAKEYRKARRGERRSRSGAEQGGPVRGKPGGKAGSAKSSRSGAPSTVKGVPARRGPAGKATGAGKPVPGRGPTGRGGPPKGRPK